MRLTGQDIRHINTVTHDGKVVVFGTAADGSIYYSVKRSGFEDSALGKDANPFGFEPWKKLRTGESVDDASVVEDERQKLVDTAGAPLLRSLYGNTDEATKSAAAPVVPISALEHIYVFRQSTQDKLVASRFVLDGMTNELVPKLEVRFRRSRQRLTPSTSMQKKGGSLVDTDSLDFKDMNGQSFYEPAIELSFLGTIKNGSFSVAIVPTNEADVHRFHIFVHDPTLGDAKPGEAKPGKIVAYTVRASKLGWFDLTDSLYADPDRNDPENKTYRMLPGIYKRVLDLKSMTVAGRPSATTYDIQRERVTDGGEVQLMREDMRLMLVVPVLKDGETTVKAAALSFALGADGTLGQVDNTPDETSLLRSQVRDLALPLTLLDQIKEIALESPPPAGAIKVIQRGEDDHVQVTSTVPLPAGFVAGKDVRVRGTKSYDGYYKVKSVDGNTFEIGATFTNNEPGFWEEVPKKTTGLVFDNMIVGYEKSATGNLKIICPAHDLKAGDEVQISGTHRYDGIYPVEKVGSTTSFTLDTPFFTGEAGNLTRVKRRGLRMDGDDRIVTPRLPLTEPALDRTFERTISAWIRVDAPGNTPRIIAADGGEVARLQVNAANCVELVVSMEGATPVVAVDPTALAVNAWIHFAGTYSWDTITGGTLRLKLFRNGVEVASREQAPAVPCHLKTQTILLNGTTQYVEVAGASDLFQKDFTLSCWTRVIGGPSTFRSILTCRTGDYKGIILYAANDNTWQLWVGDGKSWSNRFYGPAVTLGAWVHIAATRSGSTFRMYVNNKLVGPWEIDYKPPQGVPMRFGTGATEGLPQFYSNGLVADVRVYDRPLLPDEIKAEMARRPTGREPGLLGYWPLDDGTAADLSTAKRAGVIQSAPALDAPKFVYPRPIFGPTHLAGMPFCFDGADDSVSVPTINADFSGGFTVEAWVRFDTLEPNVRIIDFGNGAASDNILLCTGDFPIAFDVKFSVCTGSESKDVVTQGGLLVTKWMHFAVTVDTDGTTRIYKNGALGHSGRAVLPKAIARTKNVIGKLCHGSIADVRLWTCARSAADIQKDMSRRLSGKEPSLVGYWPLDDGTARDLSPSARHGTLSGAPERVATPFAGAHRIGEGFVGEIADVQIWDRARPEAEIKDTMHLSLTGKEPDLAGYYRMGAIAYEASPVVPDFTIHGNDGLVFGNPYAGARDLARATPSGKKAVMFGCDELVAVTQRATYEESFEFRVNVTDPTFNVNNADGKGKKLFFFSYWGKRGRGTEERTPFPSASYVQSDFKDQGGGWFRAACRFTVPAEISLVRAFEINQLAGRWNAEASPPANEWKSISIRKHRLQMLNDSVTRETYTDAPDLALLTGSATGSSADQLAAVRRAERDVDRLTEEIFDLDTRIDVVKDRARFERERDGLNAQLATLANQQKALQAKLDADNKNPVNNYCWIRSVDFPGYLLSTVEEYLHIVKDDGSGGNCDWSFQCSRDGKTQSSFSEAIVTIFNRTLPGTHLDCVPGSAVRMCSAPQGNGAWKLQATEGGAYQLLNATGGVGYLRAASGGWYEFQNSPWVTPHTFRIEPGTPVPEWAEQVAKLQKEIQTYTDKIAVSQARNTWINDLLAKSEDLAVLTPLRDAARSKLIAAVAELNSKNTAFSSGLAAAPPVAMKPVATDDRGRVTTGGVLDFVRPAGHIEAQETCDGNVALSYFDNRGRMRMTCYDAAADSRNSAFEEWLPDAARACVDFRSDGAKMTLQTPVSLAPAGYTLEAWIHYPLPTNTDGSPKAYNVLASSKDGQNAPLTVRDGGRLGTQVNNFFHDSGVRLDSSLGAGYHHIATVVRQAATDFYVNGVKAGSSAVTRHGLTFNGSTDHVETPAFDSPTAALTLSVWARSETATWNQDRCVVSKRDAFVLFPMSNTRTVKAIVFGLHGAAWVDFAPDDITRWHLYTMTYDGHYMCLYVDGNLVGSMQSQDTIAQDSGIMTIGRGDKNEKGYLNGQMADVALYNRALDAGEVSALLSKAPKADDPSLEGYWPLTTVEKNGAVTATDLSTKGRHGKVFGTPKAITLTPACREAITTIGNTPSGGAPIGRIAEFRLWDAPLTDDEIAVNARALMTGNEPGLVHYWPLSEAGTSTQCLDRVGKDQVRGDLGGAASWAACTAAIGNPSNHVLQLWEDAMVAPGIVLPDAGFTIEFWAKHSGQNLGKAQVAVMLWSQIGLTHRIYTGWTSAGDFTFMPPWEAGGLVSTKGSSLDAEWHHWCCTFDSASREQGLYCDGELVGKRTAQMTLLGRVAPYFGQAPINEPRSFYGQLAEVRIWGGVRTAEEIKAAMRTRATGKEAGLLACYPFESVTSSAADASKMVSRDLVDPTRVVEMGGAQLVQVTDLPLTGADHLVTAEYSAVTLSTEGKQQAMMRRFMAFPRGGEVELLPEQRVDELALKWIGNMQLNPTLLGYIEGAPPVPSENLTRELSYRGATSITLSQSNDVEYRWERSEDSDFTFNTSGFLGMGWETEIGGLTTFSKLTAGEVGASFNFSHTASSSSSSAIGASSSLATSDKLQLMGTPESDAKFSHLGPRYVPKNVGYALVVSGMADMFVTKLKRSGRMVSYEIRPVEGIPLDVNTITFMINPAYTLNGSLDGLVGSMPADERFYFHVPDMRAQYGSLYPASYFRLKESYALKEQIERMDAERASYFASYDVSGDAFENIDESAAEPKPIALGDAKTGDAKDAQGSAADGAKANAAAQGAEMKTQGESRQAEIEKRVGDVKNQARASAAFNDWQKRMERIQLLAGKRNIVNTYVWDADGGLRAESQSFASTIEHSLGSVDSNSGEAGAEADVLAAVVKFKFSAMFGGGKTKERSKTMATSKSLTLEVDLSGVEDGGVTDAQDRPLLPGEKVDRYRFMSFYLEGSTDHFHDFFGHVVDPEWLQSNDEEARALRQTRAGRVNKCWRVLHRVTYVERPALLGFGAERASQQTTAVVRSEKTYLEELDKRTKELQLQMNAMKDLLERLATK